MATQMSLECEVVVGRMGDKVSINAVYKNGSGQLTTATNAKAGGAIFLGTIDPDADSLEFAFVTNGIQR